MADFTDESAILADQVASVGVRADEQIKALTQTVVSQEVLIEEQAAKIAELSNPTTPTEPPPDKVPVFMKVGSSLYRGTSETYQQGYDDRAKKWGAAPELVRYFYPGLPTGNWPQFGTARSVVSFKPANINDFIAGKNDAQVNAFLDTCAEDGTFHDICIFHEEEDDIERGAFTIDQAKRMDVKLKNLVDVRKDMKPKAKYRIGKIFMAWSLDPRSNRDITKYLPTDWKFDWLGWDAYPGNYGGYDLPDFKATKLEYTRCRTATEAHGAPIWMICETGTSNHGDTAAVYDDKQAQWITGSIQIASDLGCRGYMYFDSTVGGDFRILGPKGFNAMGTAIKR